MNELKEYKKLTTIQLFEWEILTETSIEDLELMINSAKQFIRFGDEIINKNQIKKIFIRKIDWMENFILSQTKEIQRQIKIREAIKKARIWKWFESIEEIQNFINKHLENESKNQGT